MLNLLKAHKKKLFIGQSKQLQKETLLELFQLQRQKQYCQTIIVTLNLKTVTALTNKLQATKAFTLLGLDKRTSAKN